MNISRRSWHYRWLVWLEAPIPYNLCSYFWTLVLSFMLGAVLVIPSPIVLLVVLVTYLHKKYKKYRWSQESQPSIVGEWLKAKKRKVCPLIEYIE